MNNLFDLASSQLGKTEAIIGDYLRTGGANLNPQQLAWCAAFVNSTLKQSGLPTTGSNLARSFLGYGQPVNQPQRGDIAVFSRGDPNGPYGHVGFFAGYDPQGRIQVLGGNQGNSVSVAAYDPSRLLGFRRPGGDQPAGGSIADMYGAPPGDGQTQTAQGQINPNAVAALTGFNPMGFMQQRTDQRRRQEAEAEAERTRKAALFGDSLGSLYG